MADYETTVIETDPSGSDDGNGRNLLRLAGMILAAIIVGVLLILAAKWVYNSVTDNDSRQGIVEPTGEKKKSPSTTEKPAAGSNGTTTAPQPSASNPQPATQTPRTGSQQLPNSGPGQVAAVFAGSGAIAAGAHYILSRRR